MLMKKVDRYLALRRAAGYALEVPEYHLRNYSPTRRNLKNMMY
jgi:hypothetical protein